MTFQNTAMDVYVSITEKFFSCRILIALKSLTCRDTYCKLYHRLLHNSDVDEKTSFIV